MSENEQDEILETEETSESAEPDLQAEVDKMKDQWMRAIAELDNTRRRAQKDREDALKYAVSNFARDILSVYDSLSKASEMASAVTDVTDEMKGFLDGVNLTLSELNNVFGRYGIQIVNPENQAFDPNFHQAMFEVPTADVAPGQVVQVMQVGFTLHDRLLRPALVGVSKKN
jgi:molecular chaperone GrpE